MDGIKNLLLKRHLISILKQKCVLAMYVLLMLSTVILNPSQHDACIIISVDE